MFRERPESDGTIAGAEGELYVAGNESTPGLLTQ